MFPDRLVTLTAEIVSDYVKKHVVPGNAITKASFSEARDRQSLYEVRSM